jgi:TPR repeat protein
MYANGWGVQRDVAEAKKWLDRAAGQASPEARCALADLYRDGAFGEKNYAEALTRYSAAAGQGASCGQNGLGYLHANGLGVPIDYDESLRWYEVAAAKGDRVARENIDRMQTGWVLAPLFAGPWRTLSGAERRAEITNLKSAKVLEDIVAADVRRLRKLDLDFYPDAAIYELEVGRPTGKLGIFTYIRHRDRLVRVDGRSAQVHDLSARAPIRIDTIQRAISYLRFFLGAIQGDEGIFRLIDGEQDLHWLASASAEARDGRRLRIERLEVEPSASGGWRAHGTVEYSDVLFGANLWLKPDGAVEMTDDTPLGTALPVAVERFDEKGIRVLVPGHAKS